MIVAEPIAERPASEPQGEPHRTSPTRELPRFAGDHDTDVITPVDGGPPPPPPKKKRKWIGWVIALVVAIGVGVAVWLVGDALARNFATDYIRERVVELLSLEPGTAVGVDLGEGSVLAQAISGRIAEVDVAVDDVSFGELTGDLVLMGTGIPLNPDAPTDQLRARFTVSEAGVARIGSSLSDLEPESIELDEGEIKVGSEFSFFDFITVHLGVGLTPSADDGQIVFDPTSLRLGDGDVSASELERRFGGIASSILASRSLCIAEHVPEALVLSDAAVLDDSLVLKFEADGTPLGDASLSIPGVCG